ncbi:hypothetical protein C8Q72DRAFT_778542 [Fomitopsis betulina]|nr:hypothetical protein C8Q72DRAFT_778542 [Fomitopsis betulina]
MLAAHYHPAVLREWEEAEAANANPVQFAFESLLLASGLRHCVAPGYDETFASAQRSFTRCAGCSVMRYCSRECHKKAWKHTKFTHKVICTKLRVLRKRTRLPNNRGLGCDDCLPFMNACNADEGLTALAEDCAKHMYNLLAERQDYDESLVPEFYRSVPLVQGSAQNTEGDPRTIEP